MAKQGRQNRGDQRHSSREPAFSASSLCYTLMVLNPAVEKRLTAVTVLTIILLIAATAASVALVWACTEVVAAMRSVKTSSDDVRTRLVPLLEKTDVAVDAASAELLRIDAAVTRFEDASVRVSAATGTLSDIIQAPGEIVSGVAERVRRAWRERRHAGSVHEPTEHGQDEAADKGDDETSYAAVTTAVESPDEMLVVTDWPMGTVAAENENADT